MSEVLSSTTLDASGGADPDAATNPKTTTGASKATLYLNGDADSTDLDIELQARQSSTKEWHTVDNETITNENVTEGTNNNKAYDFDIEGFNKEIRWFITNNAASSTDISANAEKAQNR